MIFVELANNILGFSEGPHEDAYDGMAQATKVRAGSARGPTHTHTIYVRVDSNATILRTLAQALSKQLEIVPDDHIQSGGSIRKLMI